jgi:multisubunit Na+/H+ antiporter MnhE subunit
MSVDIDLSEEYIGYRYGFVILIFLRNILVLKITLIYSKIVKFFSLFPVWKLRLVQKTWGDILVGC